MTAKPTPRAWQRMLSGRRLDLLDPAPLDVEIADIAHGLARVARWNGQTKGPHIFSVAQHCLLVEVLFSHNLPGATNSNRLAALLHDSAEYVIGDMISPFKAVIGDEYREVEQRILGAIHVRFGLPMVLPSRLSGQIKQADRLAAYHEAVLLAGFGETESGRFFGRPATGAMAQGLVLADHLAPKPPDVIEKRFLNRFATLYDAS